MMEQYFVLPRKYLNIFINSKSQKFFVNRFGLIRRIHKLNKSSISVGVITRKYLQSRLKMLKEYDEGFKVIIAGSSGVGKSCLLLRFVDNVFSSNTISTIGVDFKFKTMDINGTTIKMQIWDTAGSQNFRSIVSAYYRGANAVVLVYKIDDKLSFNQLNEFWMQEVNMYKQAECEIMLIANMSDLQENKVPEEQVRKFMDQHGITLFTQASAKTGDNVMDAFKWLGQKLLQKNRKNKPSTKKETQFVKLDVGDPYQQESQNPKKKLCCAK